MKVRSGAKKEGVEEDRGEDSHHIRSELKLSSLNRSSAPLNVVRRELLKAASLRSSQEPFQ